MKNLNEKRPSGLALLPFAMFIFIYMGAGIYYQVKGMEMAFYQFPSVTAMFLAVLVAFIMFKGTINEKFDTFAKGAANVDILTMLMIYILAGAFANVAAVMGGRESTVNLGLSLVPVEFLAAGLFVISAFMGTATGSSMGTVTAVIPIAVGIAEKGGLSLTVVIGAVVGGAMFGDNLSMISDTTIAATRSQRCEMRDKFRVNFLIALPAALITLVLLLIFGRPETVMPLEALPFDLIKVLPYVLVLVLALCGLNVFLALTVGIFSAGLVGICCGDLTIAAFAQSVWDGFTANNTVAIIVAGDMARDVSHEYKVDPRRTASLLDIFSCVFQGIIPYGAQLLSAAALANATVTSDALHTSPAAIVGGMWYCWILAAVGLLSIFVPFADGVCRKDPWNWEYGCAQSAVAAKKALLEKEAEDISAQ